MNGIRQLIKEIHRRSLWQVLGIFLAASWGVLQVVEVLTETAGLPDWTPSMALVLLLIGLPVCLATAFVQEGMPGQAQDVAEAPDDDVNLAAGTGSLDRPSTRPSSTRRLLTWRNAILGGVAAFAVLGLSVAGYFVMWFTGVGPVGSLQAQGLIEEGAPVLLADFRNSSDNPSLGNMVTEALRVDLARAQTITLVEASAAADILTLMGRPDDVALQGTIADEVAVRGGYSAIIEGEVGSAGTGYMLLASIRSADGGRTLATFRRTAGNDDEVIEAIDGLSQDIRERAGESLRSIRAGEPLEAVTTSSLEALRLFTEAWEARAEGEDGRARALIEEALRLDPEFAMAWRGLSIILQDTGGDREAVRDAANRAYELRHRLTDRERYKAVAQYHREVTGDIFQEMDAYQTLLDVYPDDRTGLNNLSIAYTDLARWEEASELLTRAIDGPGSSFAAYSNRVLYASLGGDFDAARAYLAELEEEYPGSLLWTSWGAYILALSEGNSEEALRRAVDLQGVRDAPNWRRTGTRGVALAYAVAGEMGAAREAFAGARAEAEREGSPRDAAQALFDQAQAELLVGEGVADDPVRTLLDSRLLDRIPPALRGNLQWIPLLAWMGFEGDARRLLTEWESAAADLQAAPIGFVRDVVEAYALADDDPSAAAATLERIRTALGCERCAAWELGTLYERAGRIEEARRERRRSLESGQDFYYGLHRIAALEALGRLSEQAGDTTSAIEHYTAYVDQLAGGPDLPRVREARERLAALGAGG